MMEILEWMEYYRHNLWIESHFFKVGSVPGFLLLIEDGMRTG
jgi:hypothetical protein